MRKKMLPALYRMPKYQLLGCGVIAALRPRACHRGRPGLSPPAADRHAQAATHMTGATREVGRLFTDGPISEAIRAWFPRPVGSSRESSPRTPSRDPWQCHR
jgi:hypothetical protein